MIRIGKRDNRETELRKGEAADLRADGWAEDDIAWALGDDYAVGVEKSGSGNRNTKEREEMASGKKGTAMSGGRYPIGNSDELHKAIRAIGRGKGSHAAIRAHIKSAAAKLGLTSQLPDSWSGAAAKSEDMEIEVDIFKSEKQGIVYGIVLEPNLEDSQGDVVSPEDIEKACHAYMIASQKADKEHDNNVNPNVHLVENYIAPTHMLIPTDDPDHPALVTKGSWVQGWDVRDDPVLKKEIEDEEITGLSLAGTGLRVPIEA